MAETLKNNPGKIREAFTILGMQASKDVQQKIENGIDPPLARSTVEKKAARGKQDPNTALIDSGTLQESIGFEVKI